jgi:hypothetical protein
MSATCGTGPDELRGSAVCYAGTQQDTSPRTDRCAANSGIFVGVMSYPVFAIDRPSLRSAFPS